MTSEGNRPVEEPIGGWSLFEQMKADFRSHRQLPVVQDGLRKVQTRVDHLMGTNRPVAACQRGCSFCCHLQVGVTAPEVFAVVDYARSHFSPTLLESVTERAEQNALAVRGLPAKAQAAKRRLCAFLEDGACLVYEARPVHCRRYHSLEVEPCRRAFEEHRAPETLPQGFVHLVTPIEYGFFASALKEASLDDTEYELQPATAIALRDPALPTKWMRGDASALSPATCPDDPPAKGAKSP